MTKEGGKWIKFQEDFDFSMGKAFKSVKIYRISEFSK